MWVFQTAAGERKSFKEEDLGLKPDVIKGYRQYLNVLIAWI